MGKTVRAYAIATDAIAAEKERAGNTDDMDITNVVALDKLELRDVGRQRGTAGLGERYDGDGNGRFEPTDDFHVERLGGCRTRHEGGQRGQEKDEAGKRSAHGRIHCDLDSGTAAKC